MKFNLYLTSILFSLFFSNLIFSQNKQSVDSLGLPGDNLNLYLVMDAFRESETLEAFEKRINDKENKINNLDLNDDDKVDYIKVTDNKNGDSHLIVLQTDVTEKEKQDIAVITVDKNDKGEYKVQMVGDPELYGKDYIIEPNDNNAGKANSNVSPAKSTKKSDTTVTADGKTVIINNTTNNYYYNNETKADDDYKPVPPVQQWVIVQYVYAPAYVPYYSPWYWGYYPPYWHAWTPLFWHNYYWHHHHHWHHHHFYYHHSPYFYSKSYATHYAPRRSISNNYVEKKAKGNFIKNYSRPDLGKPPVGRPNPGYQGPHKNPPVKNNPGINPYPKNGPVKQGPVKQGPVKTAPPQKIGPKPGGGAPVQRSGGGGVKRGR